MSELLVFPAVFVALFLPGAAVLAWLRAGRFDPLEMMAESAGVSLAITGLAAYVLAFAGIRLDALGMILLYGGLVGIGVVGLARRRIRLRLSGWALLALGAVLALAAWRLYQARDLVLPAWVDSIHHTLLVRIILERGGLPLDWQPYLPVPMFYHYGFHILTGVFAFWSRLEPAQAVLVFGQVLNAMVAVSVYRLGKSVFGDARRAGLAALMTALGFHMPAYYLSWGRYPLTAGLVMLPLAMAAVLDLRRDPSCRAAWARTALYAAALTFCHYLALGLFGIFCLLVLLYEGWRVLPGLRAQRGRDWPAFRWQIFAALAIGALLVTPWLVRVWTYTRVMLSVVVTNPLDASVDLSGSWEYLGYLTGPLRSHILLGMAGVGALLCLARKRMRLLAAWGLIVAFLATPIAPRFDPFRSDHLAIVLFLPGSLLLAELLASCGEGASWLAFRLGKRLRRRRMRWLPLVG